jgi:protein-tyrosine phosphatase
LDIEGETLGPHIEKMVPIIKENVDNHINTLIHCEKGASRSASIVAAYLIKYNHMSTNTAIIFMRSKRSVINPNPDYIRQLKNYEIELRSSEVFDSEYDVDSADSRVDIIKDSGDGDGDSNSGQGCVDDSD